MLKGTRAGIVKKVQPVSIHGQISLNVFWVDPDDPDEELRSSRVAQEAVPRNIEPGDRVTLHYLMGSVTEITK